MTENESCDSMHEIVEISNNSMDSFSFVENENDTPIEDVLHK